jgi:hypothetical protein
MAPNITRFVVLMAFLGAVFAAAVLRIQIPPHPITEPDSNLGLEAITDKRSSLEVGQKQEVPIVFQDLTDWRAQLDRFEVELKELMDSA